MASIYENRKKKILGLLRQRKLNKKDIARKVGVPVAEVNAHVVDLLVERAVLTRAVCREVREGKAGPYFVRAGVALRLLERWLAENEGYSHASYDQGEIAAATSDCKKLMQEIQDGQNVCHALSLQGTADSATEAASDAEYLRKALDIYWRKHRRPVSRP